MKDVIAYDRPPGMLRSNAAFLDEIRAMGRGWANAMERTRLVYASLSLGYDAFTMVPATSGGIPE